MGRQFGETEVFLVCRRSRIERQGFFYGGWSIYAKYSGDGGYGMDEYRIEVVGVRYKSVVSIKVNGSKSVES